MSLSLLRLSLLTGSHHYTRWWSLQSECSPRPRAGRSNNDIRLVYSEIFILSSPAWEGLVLGQDPNSPRHSQADRAGQTGPRFEWVWDSWGPSTAIKTKLCHNSALVEMISLNFPPIANLYCHQVVLLLHVLHPFGRLTLRIYHQRPSARKKI